MSDAITDAIGLSDEDATSLIQKYFAFICSLNPAQQAVMQNAVPSLEAAAAAIGGETTVDDLNAYISGRLESAPTALGIPVPSATGIPVPCATGIPVPCATGIPVPSKEN